MRRHETSFIAGPTPDRTMGGEAVLGASDEVVPTTGVHLAMGGLAIAAMLSLAAVCTPLGSIPLPVVPGFFTAFATAMILLNVHAGSVMLNRGAFEGRGAATALGIAYLAVGGIFVPFVASFPDAIVSGRLLGAPGTAVLLWACWHCAFALSIARYALVAKGRARGPSPRRACVEVVVVIAGSVTFALCFADVDSVSSSAPATHYFLGESRVIPEVALGLSLAALGLCVRLRARTTEELYVTLSIAAACLDVWLTMSAGVRFSLGWYVAKGASLLSTLCATGFLMNETLRLYRLNAEAKETLQHLACIDGLTGIANRRRLDDALDVEWRRARRDRTALSLLLVDVDWFKSFNDRYGHPAGDDCLGEVARCISGAVRRPADLAARYGGEEFAVVLPNTDRAGVLVIAERVRSAVEALGIPHGGSDFGRVSVSVGASTRVPDRDGRFDDLVADADASLYRAKGAGRNRVDGVEPPVPGRTSRPSGVGAVACPSDA